METSAAMERRFEEYVSELGTVVGNDARRRGLEDYVGGLLLPGGRKSMEPIAERLDPDHVSRRHQSISTLSPRRAGATPRCASRSAPK
jgi:SRSO17 transposase